VDQRLFTAHCYHQLTSNIRVARLRGRVLDGTARKRFAFRQQMQLWSFNTAGERYNSRKNRC
jgi:hypothetical protein